MSRHAKQIIPYRLHIHRQRAESLHRIRMKQHTPLLTYPGDLLNRLQSSDFIVRMHHRNEQSLFANGLLHITRIHLPAAVNRNKFSLKAKCL